MSATKKNWDHYGLAVYELDGEEYAVGTDKQADKAAARAIEDSLWTFKTEFLLAFLHRHNPHFKEMSDSAYDALRRVLEKVQSEHGEDAGALIRALVGNALSELVQEAIRFDGRGHFLSPYDGEEHESDDIQGLPKGKVAFRLN